jgi:ketosteroid isomerase-like protein
MSQENVEVVRRLYAAAVEATWSPQGVQRDPKFPIELLDPHVVWISFRSAPESRPYIGYGGALEWLKTFQEDIRGLRVELTEVIDAGGDQVVAVNELRGTWERSGVPVEGRYASVFTLLNGRIVRVQAFKTREEALEAVGLRE